MKYFLARRVRTDLRWEAGVGAGGGDAGRVGRSGG
jgi:hypothetical protein